MKYYDIILHSVLTCNRPFQTIVLVLDLNEMVNKPLDKFIESLNKKRRIAVDVNKPQGHILFTEWKGYSVLADFMEKGLCSS